MKQAGSNKKNKPERGIAPEGLPVLRWNVAGIDLGSNSHWVCAPTVDGTGREEKVFGATTPELESLARWLQERKVESIAIESTGVYWIPAHEVLEQYQFEVVLVCTRELARVPGRTKTDRLDCQWIQRLQQLWITTRVIPAARTGVHVANASTRQREPGSRTRGLAAADAEEPGSDECTRAPGSIGYRGDDREIGRAHV